MFFTINELLDLVIMIIAVGFIFKDSFQTKVATSTDYDPISELRKSASGSYDLNDFWLAAIAAAPAVVFHELSHKFSALFFGIQATFHAHYFWLIIGVSLKMLGFPFVFFVPGYVSYSSENVPLLSSAVIAIAGPLMNLFLFIFAWAYLKYGKVKNKKVYLVLHLTKNINLLLFFFNMIPVPPFDGGHFFLNLYQIFFGG